jgi:AMP-binding enzyme
MEMHFATVWESIADAIPEATALVHGTRRVSWSGYDTRAARLAQAFCDAGLQPGSKVGLYLYNSTEYMESQYAGFKMRAVPVNVNYRYLDAELAYLLENADAEALVFHSSLGDRVARVVHRLPLLKLLIEVDDGDAGRVPGAVSYDAVLAAHEPMPRIARPEDDLYMLYTGGTTGMPKGVMYAIGGMTAAFSIGSFPLFGLPAPSDAASIAPIVAGAPARPVSIPGCPLMHGTEPRYRRRLVRQTDDSGARRIHLRHSLGPRDHLVGRDVDERGEAGVDRTHSAGRAVGRDGVDGRLDGDADHDEGPAGRNGEVQPKPHDEGVHRRRSRRRAGLGRDRHGRGGR